MLDRERYRSESDNELAIDITLNLINMKTRHTALYITRGMPAQLTA